MKASVKSPLIRYSAESLIDFAPENLIFIGNGVFENGWVPLEETVKVSNSFFNSTDQWEIEDLAHVLSLASYRFRSIRSYFLNTAIAEGKTQINDPKGFSSFLGRFLVFRRAVSESYHSSKLTIRPLPKELEGILFDESSAIITTNWDETIWKMKVPNLIHLHGRSEYPDSLIFPTEFSDDDSLALQLVINGRNDFEWLWKEFYRGPMAHQLFNAHATASRWLSRTKNIYIWGLAFHEYDAELNHLFSTVPSKYLPKNIRVFDDPHDSAKSIRIEKRITNLLNTFIVKETPEFHALKSSDILKRL